jgi:hypothetical protein
VTAAAAPAGGDGPLAGHARLIRDTADLIEQAGLPGLAVYPGPDEIVIQVPETFGDIAARTGAVARLAALTGAVPAPDPRPGVTRGWILARGQFAGHLVHVYAPVSQETAP